jgi:hypothetical protein
MQINFMKNEPDPKLTAWLQRELRQLPELRAPATLIPRVLQAIEMRARQWWRRPWLAWPLSAQLLSGAFLLVILGAGIYVWEVYSPNFVLATLAQHYPRIESLWSLGASLGNSLILVTNASQPWLCYITAAVVLMYFCCIGLGAVCFRVAFGGVSKR